MSEQLTPEAIQEALLIFCDAVDAATTQLRTNLGEKPAKASPKLTFDAAKIMWQPKEREDKSQFEMAFPDKNVDNKNFENLQIFLRSAGGRVASEDKFYWLFPDDKIVGRQDQKKKA